MRSIHDRLMDVIGERAEQRVYDILYMLCERFRGELRFTSKEIVELSGTKTETLIKDLCRAQKFNITSCGRRDSTS